MCNGGSALRTVNILVFCALVLGGMPPYQFVLISTLPPHHLSLCCWPHAFLQHYSAGSQHTQEFLIFREFQAVALPRRSAFFGQVKHFSSILIGCALSTKTDQGLYSTEHRQKREQPRQGYCVTQIFPGKSRQLYQILRVFTVHCSFYSGIVASLHNTCS